ncbi:MAG: flagella basal body P-ring formation protein FlgA, partial [Ramlibacter sp.]|uniref:flagella basal body P-ring formation protein FlgA n=1 Tax=Ramlibacter sp. TaxID=1917967 RepID=UPI0026094232
EGLRHEDVEPLLAVARGEWASLRSGAGAVHTEARVRVLQDGRVGDNVRVRPSAAAASLVARVTGTGQLEVAR